jgi:hypothetical protein
LIGLFVLSVFNFLSCLCILDINSMSDEQLAKIFFYSEVCLHSIDCFFCYAQTFQFDTIPFVNSSYFLSFKVLGLTLRSLIHFELIFIESER